MDRKTYLRNYMRQYRQSHGEPWKKGYRTRLRTKVMDMLGGPKCVNCGCDEKSILEINHVNGGGNKDLHDRDLTALFRDIIKGRRDIAEFNVLCKPCNMLHYVTEILKISGHKITWNNAGVV